MDHAVGDGSYHDVPHALQAPHWYRQLLSLSQVSHPFQISQDYRNKNRIVKQLKLNIVSVCVCGCVCIIYPYKARQHQFGLIMRSLDCINEGNTSQRLNFTSPSAVQADQLNPDCATQTLSAKNCIFNNRASLRRLRESHARLQGNR